MPQQIEGLPQYDAAAWAEASRAAAAAAPKLKKAAERLARLAGVLADLDAKSAAVLRAVDPEAEAAKLARALWSLRHEGVPGAVDVAGLLTHLAAEYGPLADALLGEYWPTNPKTGEPLVPGFTRLGPAPPE
jgi:hypothetical protein